MKNKTLFTAIVIGLIGLFGFGAIGATINNNQEIKEVRAVSDDEIRYFKSDSSYSQSFAENYVTFAPLVDTAQSNYDLIGTFRYYDENDTLQQYFDTPFRVTITYRYVTNQLNVIQIRIRNDNGLDLIALNTENANNIVYVPFYFTINSITAVGNNNYVFTEKYEGSFISVVSNVAFSTNDLKSTFYFSNVFNYNAFFQLQSWDSPIPREYYPIIGGLNHEQAIETYTFDLPYFMSNGQIFNRIVARFEIATTDLYFQYNDSYVKSKLIDGVNPYKFFSSLTYVDTFTNYSVVACRRNEFLNGDGNTYIKENVTWATTSYQTLQFYGNISNFNSIVLSMTQNISGITGFTTNGGDVGLGGAFSLIGQAFTAWLPILQVSIVPGITLGLLIFLPLIAGIIIFIIWIVKR